MSLRADITDILRAADAVRAAWLFGSAARGQMRSDSDVDVAVLADAPLASPSKKQLVEQLAHAAGQPVDLIDLQVARGPIVGQVLQTGDRLFCEDASLYGELMKRWMFDQADWMPLRRRILKTRRQTWIDR